MARVEYLPRLKTLRAPGGRDSTRKCAQELANEIRSFNKLGAGGYGDNPGCDLRGVGQSRWQQGRSRRRRRLDDVPRQSSPDGRRRRESSGQIVAALELQDRRAGQIVPGKWWP